ncbi:MAG: oligosaccharide flippase family protein, partial [Elusimicrobia bacterium]|nr:oligosaccharide flippase family protein [Elusimicrobiota bacterium]
MLADIARLGRETAVYGLSTVVGRLLNFLLLPLYTHLLAPAEYGVVATAFAYIAFLNVAYQYGMDQAYLRFSSPDHGGATRESFSTPFWSVAAVSSGASLLLILGAEPLALGAGVPAWAIRLGAAILALDALQALPLAELRRDHRAWYYVGVKIASIAVNVALNVLLLWRWKLGAEGVFWASLAASAASLALLLPVLLARLELRFELPLCERMLRFALPYVPAGLASMSVQLIDRPILAAMTNDATVGLYQANHRLGIAMAMAVNMFDAAWRPFFLERGARAGAPELFGRIMTYWVLGASALFLALSAFMPELVRLPLPVSGRPLIHPQYWEGLGIVPVILFAYLLNGVYLNFMPQVILPKRSERVAYATAIGAAVCVAANLLLIPSLGMTGAAWATLLGYAAMAASLYLFGRRLYPVPYELGRLAQIAGALLL